MRAAFLGPAGTFSHEAVVRAGLDATVACGSIRAVVLAVQAGEAQRGVVPVENSLEGGVGATLDALVRDAPDVVLRGEVTVPVRHCLTGPAGLAPAGIREVHTHPQASAQCARYLAEHLPGAVIVPAPSTADAVRSAAAADPGAGMAAIGSEHAATLYGASVLAAGIEDEPTGNTTRFVVLERVAGGTVGAPGGPGPHRTAVAFGGPGAGDAGWLVRCLSEFAFRGVNLTRIESRPARRGMGSYVFFVDLDGAVGSSEVDGALAALAAASGSLRVLGSYDLAPGDGKGA